MPPTVAIVAAGAMGAALGARLVSIGRCTVYTTLVGRSSATVDRARKAGMLDLPLSEISSNAEWVLSVLPPSEAHNFAKSFLTARSQSRSTTGGTSTRVFVDCNAVSPATVKSISTLFSGTGIAFLDAGIIGGPPSDGYDPTIYASADASDTEHLDRFDRFNELGLKIRVLKVEEGMEGGGVGDASALKMSYAGITKGTTGLFSTMILAAHAASPQTANALLSELSESQPILLRRIGASIPPMISKAYPWVGEMEEIAAFVDSGIGSRGSSSLPNGFANSEDRQEGGTPGDAYRGLAALYARIENELTENGRDNGDVRTLLEFSGEARRVSDSKVSSK